jgi:hypothetical protein
MQKNTVAPENNHIPYVAGTGSTSNAAGGDSSFYSLRSNHSRAKVRSSVADNTATGAIED